MGRFFKIAVATVFLAVCVPSLAMATTMEYYCYGSFDPVVSAFKLIATIFGTNSYQSLFYTVIISASAFAGLAAVAKITSGGQGSILGWTVPMAIGIVIYIAFFIPKGRLQIYDQVLNKTELVANVPNGIVLVAGTFNTVERGLVEIVSNAGSVGSYQTQAGGAGFLGLYSLTTKPLLPKNDSFLELNLNQYILDCVTFAISNDNSGLSIDELRRTSASLSSSLEKAKNPAIYTKYYSATDVGGASTTCTDAWGSIVTDMTPANLSGSLESSCTEMGYDISDALQLQQCRQVIFDAQSTVGLGGLALDGFITQQFLFNRLNSVYQSGNTSGATNYQFLTNISGSMKSFNDYYPMLRGILTAVSLALIPILVIFLPTPMVGKVGAIIFGFFIWLTAWGVVDCILHGFAMSYANKVFDQVRNQGLGLDALYIFPNASVKALAMFGTLRLSGLVLSTALTGMLVKFGGHAITQMGSSLQGHIGAAGGIGASRTEDVIGNAQAVKSVTEAAPVAAWAAAPFSTRVEGAFGNLVGGTSSGLKTVGGVGQSGSVPAFYNLNSGLGKMETSGNSGAFAHFESGVAIGQQMGMSASSISAIQSMYKMNPGAFNVTMQRLQRQAADMNLSGEQAAGMYLDGKLQSEMSTSSTGVNEGFTMTNAVDSFGNSVQTATKGNLSATFSNHGLTNVSGMNSSVKIAQRSDAAFSTKIADSRAQTAAYQQQLGSSLISSLANSDSRQRIDAVSDRSGVVRSGMHAVNKSIETSALKSVANAKRIVDSEGNEVKKGTKAWSDVVAQASTPGTKLTGIGMSVSGGAEMSVGISTNSGHKYSVEFGETETKALKQAAGESWQDSVTKSKGHDLSETDQTAIAQVHSITGTRGVSEQLTASEQRTQSLEQARSATQTQSLDAGNSLDAAVINYVGNKYFGGGESGALKALNYMNELGASGTVESRASLNNLLSEFVEQNALKPTGEGLPAVQGPGESGLGSFQDTKNMIAPVAEKMVDNQNDAISSAPSGAPENTGVIARGFKPLLGVDGPNKLGYESYLSLVADNLKVAGEEWSKLNASPTAALEQGFGLKAVPTATGVGKGYVYQNPNFSEGLGARTSDVLSTVSGRKLGMHIDNKLYKAGQELSLLASGNPTVAIQNKPGTIAHIEPAPGGTSKSGSFSFLGGNR